MNTIDYLARIKYTGELLATPEVLADLQESHLLAVPFENLDIHRGERIVLETPLLFRKIVERRRGGFCYELNGLFFWLLRELGFQTSLAMGQVYSRKLKTFGPPFDHMLILVDFDSEQWLADVGYGDFSIRPLKLTLHQPLFDNNGQFIIERENDEFLKVSRFSPDEKDYVPEYLFSRKARRLEDFSAMCLYHQTSPESHFTQNRVCALATHAGRITLSDHTLIITEHGIRQETQIASEKDFSQALFRYFAIAL